MSRGGIFLTLCVKCCLVSSKLVNMINVVIQSPALTKGRTPVRAYYIAGLMP